MGRKRKGSEGVEIFTEKVIGKITGSIKCEVVICSVK